MTILILLAVLTLAAVGAGLFQMSQQQAVLTCSRPFMDGSTSTPRWRPVADGYRGWVGIRWRPAGRHRMPTGRGLPWTAWR